MAGKKSGKSIKMTGKLRSFMLWPVYMGILLLVLNVALYFVNIGAATAVSVFVIIYAIALGLMWFYFKPAILRNMVDFAGNYAQVQHQLLYDLAIPYALVDDSSHVMWFNTEMLKLTGKRKDYHKSITSIFPELNEEVLPQDDTIRVVHLVYDKHEFRVELKRVSLDLPLDQSEILDSEDTAVVAVYMFDETDINLCRKTIRDTAFVTGLIYIDNYEEALDSIDDVRKSLFVGLIDKRINKYFAQGAAVLRKTEKDKYLVVFTYQFLEKLIADKFSILDDIKGVKIGNEMTTTVSIGIGTGAEDYAKNFAIAKSAMDLALGRGGDQAVIKNGDSVTYFGGKSQQQETNTRVKVRVKAHALHQIFENNDNIMIMGHKLADIDSFGAAMGVYVIARKMKKNVHIVINDITMTVEPFITKFIDNADYPDDLFYTSQEAIEHANASTVVLVVDVNRPMMTECPELLDICKTKIVFDHHRQNSEPINGTVLSYVDSSASSACEMVSEMIQYVEEGIKLSTIEADAMFAGMVIDTDNFHSKSGPRTFEAAAFLRRNGADVMRVRKMLRTDMTEYRAIVQAVSRAEVYKDCFAIATFNGDGIKSPTIGGAKAANELLDIKGVKASFVITKYENRVFISARSIDEVNVQLIMEKFGGGGHMSIAGAQVKDEDMDTVVLNLKMVLDDMVRDGEI